MAISAELVTRLNHLLMLAHDDVDAYQQAIDRVRSNVCRDRFSEFQNDYRRHIAELRDCIKGYGVSPKDRTDLKGFFIKGIVAIQAMAGDEQAVKAMASNERLTIKQHQLALDDFSITEEARMLLERSWADSARHLDWLQEALDTRPWIHAGESGTHPGL